MDGGQSELKISMPKKNSESKQMDGLSSENGEAIARLPETLSTESNLENHLEKSGRFSGFKRNLRRHLPFLHDKRQQSFACCDITFANKGEYRKHVKARHNNSHLSRISPPSFADLTISKLQRAFFNRQKGYLGELSDYVNDWKNYLKYHYRHSRQQRLASRLANAKNSILRSKTVECIQPSPYLLNFPMNPTPEQLAEAEEAVRQKILLSSCLRCGQLIPRQADLEKHLISHRDEDPAYEEVDMVEPNNTPASSSLTESMNDESCDQSLPNPGQGSWDIVHMMNKFKINRH